MKRLLLTGSREWVGRNRLEAELSRHVAMMKGGRAAPRDEVTLVHGECPVGADQMADDWARSVGGIYLETHPADYGKGSAAPLIRNKEMVRLGADLCLAFVTPGCRGTVHTAALAQRAGIPVVTFFETKLSS